MKFPKSLFVLPTSFPMLIFGQSSVLSVRVYGGQPAGSPNLSFVANIVSLDPIHRGKKCSGALITNNTVLTTANCLVSNSQTWYNPSLISVSFNGGSDKYKARNTITASGYYQGMFGDNIGLITLASSVDAKVAKPIGLYFGPLDESLGVYSLGYGRVNDTDAGISPEHAQTAQMQLMSDSQCMGYAGYDRNTQVCAKGKGRSGLCGGDEGAPLVTKPEGANTGHALVGVASFRARRPGSRDEGCGHSDRDDSLVYYEVGAPWASWISRMTGVSAEDLLVAGGLSGSQDGLPGIDSPYGIGSDWSMHVSAQSGAVHGSNSSINTMDQDAADSEKSSAYSAVWTRTSYSSSWHLALCVFVMAGFLM